MLNNDRLRLLLNIGKPDRIARRYFVTNGFDGALAMLGLLMGFRSVGATDPHVALLACLGTAVALGASGVSSAYISEAAERKKELEELRSAMLEGMDESAHVSATRWVPLWIALVNGLAPFLLAQIIMLPLWLAWIDIPLPPNPVDAAIAVAFLTIFSIGVFLGRISGQFWLWAGVRTTLVAALTAGIILLVAPD